MMRALFILLFLSMFSLPAHADREINFGITFSQSDDSLTGIGNDKYYAISTPGHFLSKESQGRTNVYKVQSPQDILLYTFNWYTVSPTIKTGKLTDSKSGISVIRVGASNQGSKPESTHVAIEFYLDGKLIKSYSALDIADTPKSYVSTTSGYRIFSNIPGYRWVAESIGKEGHYVYEVETWNKKIISFDPINGKILEIRNGPEIVPNLTGITEPLTP